MKLTVLPIVCWCVKEIC